jgi:hypothetical protein
MHKIVSSELKIKVFLKSNLSYIYSSHEITVLANKHKIDTKISSPGKLPSTLFTAALKRGVTPCVKAAICYIIFGGSLGLPGDCPATHFFVRESQLFSTLC